MKHFLNVIFCSCYKVGAVTTTLHMGSLSMKYVFFSSILNLNIYRQTGFVQIVPLTRVRDWDNFLVNLLVLLLILKFVTKSKEWHNIWVSSEWLIKIATYQK